MITISSSHGLSIYLASTRVLHIVIHIIIPIICKYVCKCTRSKDACMDLHRTGYSWKDTVNILDKWGTWEWSTDNKCQSQSSFQWWQLMYQIVRKIEIQSWGRPVLGKGHPSDAYRVGQDLINDYGMGLVKNRGAGAWQSWGRGSGGHMFVLMFFLTKKSLLFLVLPID